MEIRRLEARLTSALIGPGRSPTRFRATTAPKRRSPPRHRIGKAQPLKPLQGLPGLPRALVHPVLGPAACCRLASGFAPASFPLPTRSSFFPSPLPFTPFLYPPSTCCPPPLAFAAFPASSSRPVYRRPCRSLSVCAPNSLLVAPQAWLQKKTAQEPIHPHVHIHSIDILQKSVADFGSEAKVPSFVNTSICLAVKARNPSISSAGAEPQPRHVDRRCASHRGNLATARSQHQPEKLSRPGALDGGSIGKACGDSSLA
jgi:hypothetical protein